MGRKILIVDDALFMRTLIKKALQQLNDVIFLEAGDGEAACKLYEEEKPDLVIMDITMPEMDGIEALKVIRKIDPKAAVVMCSAMGQDSMVVEAIKAGAKDFIVKPFKNERIAATVNRILEG